MEMTLGASQLSQNNISMRNDPKNGGLGNQATGRSSERQNFRSSLGSVQRGVSDGQFSEYNDILRSPDR